MLIMDKYFDSHR